MHLVSFGRKRNRKHLSISSVGKQKSVSKVLKISETSTIALHVFNDPVKRLNGTI